MPEEISELPVSPQEVQIQAPSFLEKLKVHKFKILGGILGILVFTGAVFGAYKFGQRQIQPGPQPTPTPLPSEAPAKEGGPTANWKTYANTKYTFLIKYPKNWEVDEKPVPGTNIIATFKKEGEKPEMGTSYGIEIEVKENAQNLSDRKWAESEVESTGGKISDLKSTDVTVAGIKTFVFSGPLPRWTQEVVYLPHKGKIYIIRLTNNLFDESIRQNLKETFNLILSTFKFIEKASGERVECTTPRPEVCTMECITNPPYICGSDGKSYCSPCQACSNPNVEWHITQPDPCKGQ